MSSRRLDLKEEEIDNAPKEAWVQVDFKLIGWSYMDFSSTVRVDTSIHTIKEIIKKWHGEKIATLTVCKDSYQEMNELRHDQLTLEKCGIKGVSDKDNAPAVTLYYDFKLDGSSEPDPILLC